MQRSVSNDRGRHRVDGRQASRRCRSVPVNCKVCRKPASLSEQYGNQLLHEECALATRASDNQFRGDKGSAKIWSALKKDDPERARQVIVPLVREKSSGGGDGARDFKPLKSLVSKLRRERGLAMLDDWVELDVKEFAAH